jgi:hypothetical protein
MSAFIRPNRTEVSRAFPVLGFTIRTGATPAWFEVAVATQPELLFSPESKAKRNHHNFYSSRAVGLLPAERGEAVYLVPPAVLARFAGQDRLYYGLAVYRQADFRNPEVVRIPIEVAPAVTISKSFTGNLRSLTGVPNPRGGLIGGSGGYVNGNQAALEWGGDSAAPGEMRAVATPTPANGRQVPEMAVQPVASQSAALEYDDGFDR